MTGQRMTTAERVQRKFGGAVAYIRKPNMGARRLAGIQFWIADNRVESTSRCWTPGRLLAAGKISRSVEEFERNPEAGMVYHAYCEC